MKISAPLLATALAAAVPSLAAPSPEIGQRAHAMREHSFVVPRPPADAFPLFEPVGEKNWAEGWHPLFASPADLPLHDGSVFTVSAPKPGGGMLDSVWTVSRYDPPHAIEYRNFIFGVRATRISVRCTAEATGTRVTVRYDYSALSDEGDAFVRGMTEEQYRAMIDSWSQAIAAFLQRGTPATP